MRNANAGAAHDGAMSYVAAGQEKGVYSERLTDSGVTWRGPGIARCPAAV